MTKKQKNIRLPDITLAQIEALKAKTGMTETQLVIMAIDRLAKSELRKDRQQQAREERE